MRLERRVSFAAPFVMVVGSIAACGGNKTPAPTNPPTPESSYSTGSRTAEQCKEIQRDTPCMPLESCEIQSGCGLNGWQCRDGKWHEVMKLCNPPPPSDNDPGPSPGE